jgi:hypothetical protein
VLTLVSLLVVMFMLWVPTLVMLLMIVLLLSVSAQVLLLEAFLLLSALRLVSFNRRGFNRKIGGRKQGTIKIHSGRKLWAAT